LPEPELEFEKEYVAPRNELEKKLAEIWSELLGIKQENIGIDVNFFEVGGHSLRATFLVSAIHKDFNVRVPLVKVFEIPTIRDLAKYTQEAAKDLFVSIPAVEAKEYYVLSPAQNRLYILQQMAPEATAYNIIDIVELEGEPHKERLEKTFRELINRHESLRTSFVMAEGKIVQGIHREVNFEIEYFDLKNTQDKVMESKSDATNIVNRFIRSFDLTEAPLFRAGLIKMRAKYILMVDMHHIISDGISMRILVNDFLALYQEGTLPELNLQYKDYSEWMNERKGTLKKQEEYWLNQFDGPLPALHLPTDFERPAVKSFEGDYVSFEISSDETKALKEIALEEGSTLFMVILAAYNVFLSKLSAQEDIVVGTPIAGRKHADLGRIIGMFVGALALRNYPTPSKTFRGFLREVKQRALDAFDNEDYPVEELQDKTWKSGDNSRNPLFDVFFQLNVSDFESGDIPENEVPEPAERAYEFEHRTSKFDLFLLGREVGEGLAFSIEYCTRLFRPETIEMFVKNFKEIISQVVDSDNKDARLGQITVSHDIYAEALPIPETDFVF
jgi:acyl carrier protein